LLAVDAPAASYMSGGTIGIGYLQDYLETLVQQNKAKVLLVTDACRSGKLAGGMEGAKQTTTALQAQWASIIKILSSQSGELSYESQKWAMEVASLHIIWLTGCRDLPTKITMVK